MRSGFLQSLPVVGEQRSFVATRRVAHQYDPPRVAAELLRVLLHPRDCLRTVVDKGRKPHLRIQTVVRQHRDYSPFRERRSDKTIEASTALGPRATVEEDDDRAILRINGRIDVELLPRFGSVGVIRRAVVATGQASRVRNEQRTAGAAGGDHGKRCNGRQSDPFHGARYYRGQATSGLGGGSPQSVSDRLAAKNEPPGAIPFLAWDAHPRRNHRS